MNDCFFHAGLTGIYVALALEAWRIDHRRFAFWYFTAACLSLVFAVVNLPSPAGHDVAVWV